MAQNPVTGAPVRLVVTDEDGTFLDLGGEDFSAFSRRVTATYAIIGSGSAGFDYPHHHPKFALDEGSFGMALQMMIDVGCNGRRFAGNARPYPT